MSSTSSDRGLEESLEQLLDALGDLGDEPLLVVTGAGISRASGISTFRGAERDAIWKVSDVELATFDYFQRDPVGQWRWYLERFRAIEGARPNPGHLALRRLEDLHTERGGKFTLVTQNIDTLHEQAGSRRLIKIHGTSDRLRCSRAGCRLAAPRGSVARPEADLQAFRDAPSLRSLPQCPRCSAPLRAHVLFFDEYYQEHEDYRFEEAMHAAAEASLVLFVGTSFSVGITDLIGRGAAMRRTPMLSIDPNPSPHAGVYRITQLEATSEELLPRLVDALADRGVPQPLEGS